MTSTVKKAVLIALATSFSIFGATRAASAGQIKFDYNSLSTSAPMTGTGSVQTYMNTILSSNGGGSVALTGTGLSGSSTIVTNNYNGEGYVIGPGGVSVTLATTDNGVGHPAPNDNFLYTFTGSDIRMVFTNITPVTSIDFDYEIFPNDQCPNALTCGTNVPDFSFWVDGVKKMQAYAVNPPANSDSPNTLPAGSGGGYETHPQLGPQHYHFDFAGPTTNVSLIFADWPATIGIDNVTFNTPNGTNAVPEPGTMILLGSGLTALAARFRKKTAKKQ